MERVTIGMSGEFAGELSAFMESAGYANRSEALRGVTHGQVSFIPVSLETEAHRHGGDGSAAKHLHAHPKGMTWIIAFGTLSYDSMAFSDLNGRGSILS